MKSLKHYLLFGSPTARATRSMLLGSRDYISRFLPAVGFDVNGAMSAQSVTIMGDARAVAAEVDARLRDAGCQVERLGGDLYAVAAILSDRVTRNTEFG